MSPSPSVTVVVPVFNAGDEIRRVIESLLALDWPAEQLQIVVVDNGSTDRTAAIARLYPVTVIEETQVQSSYAARNRGLSVARGDWVAFTDADCVADPAWLRHLLLPEPAAHIGAVAGEVLALEAVTPIQRLVEHQGIMKHAVTLPHKALPCFSTANVAIRRSLLQKLKGFRDDVRFFADMELSWRLQLETGQAILFRPEGVIRHRHRRTWKAFWRQAVQHGQGVAFMKRTYPAHYRIHPGEQVRRLRQLARSMLTALTGTGTTGRPTASGKGKTGPLAFEPARAQIEDHAGGALTSGDRLRMPVFLSLWYSGLLWGYLRGPANSSQSGSPT